jgi:hypothetical protein
MWDGMTMGSIGSWALPRSTVQAETFSLVHAASLARHAFACCVVDALIVTLVPSRALACIASALPTCYASSVDRVRASELARSYRETEDDHIAAQGSRTAFAAAQEKHHFCIRRKTCVS